MLRLPCNYGVSSITKVKNGWHCLAGRKREGIISKHLVHRSLASSSLPIVDDIKTSHVHLNETVPSPVTYVHSSLSEGLISYPRGWAWQQSYLSQRLAALRNQPQNDSNHYVEDHDDDEQHPNHDRLLLFQHEPVYTLGRGADESHITFLQNDDERRHLLSRKVRGPGTARLTFDERASRMINQESNFKSRMTTIVDQMADAACPVLAPDGTPVFRVERGGEVTCHLPGQLVVYPLVNLRQSPFQQDLHWYLRMVEQVIIETLKVYDIEGTRDEEHTGVWVGEGKIAAVGVSSSRWITTHGFAINISPDLSLFDNSLIIPCGIEGRAVTSIERVLKDRSVSNKIPSLQQVATDTVKSFETIFGVHTKSGSVLN
uniref:lipoyl(octanoyl) transferase n=1 Tax=Attheya septentrionalis TaxID=420275 RepID=A0A7S2UPC7_9STRA|mmetsp:Transcript_3921/g.7058  ORF Transcript_3921/g.7058 Transcript_3921/m.7058 type:complete len:373 (+) Transcript_3921:138-1256(+)